MKDSKTKKRSYSVAVTVSFDLVYDVLAENEEEARDIAEEIACGDDYSNLIPDEVRAWNVVENKNAEGES